MIPFETSTLPGGSLRGSDLGATRSTLIWRALAGISDRRRDTAFNVCTTDMIAKKRGKAIRRHQGVENRAPYVRKFAMQVDACRIQTKPSIIDRALRFGLNIERTAQENIIANARRCNTLDIKQVL